MIDKELNEKASRLIEKSKKKGLIKTYDEFCETKEAEEYALSEDDVIYYTSQHEGRK